MTSSEEDLLGTEMTDVEEHLVQSVSSLNTDDGTDDDTGVACTHSKIRVIFFFNIWLICFIVDDKENYAK